MTVPDYLNVAVNGVPLVFVIMGLTYLYGMFGATGKLQLGLSVGTGIVTGAGYMISQSGMPVDFAGWFGTVVFALAMGLLPAGTYESVKEAARKSRE